MRTGCLILVAEDNPTNRLVVGKQLSRLGYAFEMVEDGEAAWEAIQNKQYALLLTDCFMPKLDGYLLTGRIRTDESGTQRHLPIIALTASALSDDAEKCFRSGMDDYLSKPVDIKKLDALLRKWMPIAALDSAPTGLEKASSTDGTAIIDRSALANILGCDDPALFAEILTFFVESFDELNQRLQEAIVSKDRMELRNAAHAAKGAAQNAAATTLADTLTSLEKSAAKAPLKTLKSLVSDVQIRFAAVQSHVKSLSTSQSLH
jgi:CheY-like chemotaxis protein